MDLTKNLIDFGLTEKEAAIYIALLSLGRSPASAIAREAGINRSTTYVLLESLIRKGLVSAAAKGDNNEVQLFNAAKPDRFLQMAKDGARKYSRLSSLAANMLPELDKLKDRTRQRTRVRYYDGPEGLRTTYDNTLTSSETIRSYASVENAHSAMPDYFPEYYRQRTDRGIHVRSIMPDTPEARERKEHDMDELRESVLVPKETHGFSPEINIYDNKIVFMSLVEQFGIIIESKELVDACKIIFDLSWNEAKRLEEAN